MHRAALEVVGESPQQLGAGVEHAHVVAAVEQIGGEHPAEAIGADDQDAHAVTAPIRIA